MRSRPRAYGARAHRRPLRLQPRRARQGRMPPASLPWWPPPPPSHAPRRACRRAHARRMPPPARGAAVLMTAARCCRWTYSMTRAMRLAARISGCHRGKVRVGAAIGPRGACLGPLTCATARDWRRGTTPGPAPLHPGHTNPHRPAARARVSGGPWRRRLLGAGRGARVRGRQRHVPGPAPRPQRRRHRQRGRARARARVAAAPECVL